MKAGLGKGLGKLMEGDKVAAGQPLPLDKGGGSVKPLTGRGVTQLVQGTASDKTSEKALDEIPSQNGKKNPLIPTWFFYGADLLLLLLTVAVVIASPKPLDGTTVFFCGVAVALGGMLSLIGILRSARNDE